MASEFKANAEYNIKDLNNIKNYEMILDIGPSTCKINEIFSVSKTLIWNGPMGAFELEPLIMELLIRPFVQANLLKVVN